MFFLPQYSRARVGKLWLLGLLRICAVSLIIGNTNFESHLSQVLSQVKKNSFLFIIRPILPKKTSLHYYNLNFIFKILFFLFIYKWLYINSILNFAPWSTKPKMLSGPLWEKFANPYCTVLFVLLLHFTNLGERQGEWAINLRYVFFFFFSLVWSKDILLITIIWVYYVYFFSFYFWFTSISCGHKYKDSLKTMSKICFSPWL